MKARAWLAGVALLGAAVAYAPPTVALAQDNGDNPAKEGAEKKTEYDSAKAVLMSLRELVKGIKDTRHPTPEELTKYFGSAFPRFADYLDGHKDADDRGVLYRWVKRRTKYGYGQESFVRIADNYLGDNPDAEDAQDWKDAKLFARLGIEDQNAKAQEDLKKLEEEAKDDPSRRLELAALWLRYYTKKDDSDSRDKLIEKLKNDESFSKSDDEWVQRRLMRTVLANSGVEEIKTGEMFPGWSKVMKINALDGKPISLADYKGKVVLIDFWATWCGPCMHEMPNVIKLYKEAHEKGFEVIGITLDREKDIDKLKSTIAGNGRVGKMPWRQIYDGGFWTSGLAVHYGIHSIPRPVLIGPDGKVVADKLRGEALAAKVKELLGKDEPAEDGDKKGDDADDKKDEDEEDGF
jgi:thiol-disulfide isomerase/thioredoxin